MAWVATRDLQKVIITPSPAKILAWNTCTIIRYQAGIISMAGLMKQYYCLAEYFTITQLCSFASIDIRHSIWRHFQTLLETWVLSLILHTAYWIRTVCCSLIRGWGRRSGFFNFWIFFLEFSTERLPGSILNICQWCFFGDLNCSNFLSVCLSVGLSNINM